MSQGLPPIDQSLIPAGVRAGGTKSIALYESALSFEGMLTQQLTKSLTVRAHGFSAAAVTAIEAAGGTTHVIPAPWGDRRPPARGNALTNR